MLAETTRRLFAEQFPPSALAQAESGAWRAAPWAAIEHAGLPMALVPESHGGFGGDPIEALNILRLAGEFAVPAPIAETMLAAWWLAMAGRDPAEGPMTIAAAAPDDRLELTHQAGGWRLRGALNRVPWARVASRIVLVVALGDRPCLVVLPPDAVTIRPGDNLAHEPRDDVQVDMYLAEKDLAPLPPGFGVDELRLAGATARCLAIAGALERVLAMTVAYAGDRVQFGRPIGKFQAIQQNLAIMAAQTAAAGSAADLAAEMLCHGAGRLPILAAKLRCGEAAGSVAALAHQIHGAMGFTFEHSLHFFTKRLWAWREEFGNESAAAIEIGQAALTAGPDGLWPLITAI